MSRMSRIESQRKVNEASDAESEAAALRVAAVVDIVPSLPAGAADLCPRGSWSDEDWWDYAAACRRAGAGWDIGARRFVIRASNVQRAIVELKRAGYIVAVHPALLG